jgi:hypothetical protein
MWSVMMCTSGSEIKENDVGRACDTCVRRGGAYRVLVGKFEWKRIFWKPMRRWVIILWILGRNVGNV